MRPDRLEQHAHGLGGEVHAVADDLEDGLATGRGPEGGGDRAGRAVVQRRHPVEDVGDQRTAAPRRQLADPVERGAGGAGVGVGMPDRRHHGGRGQLPDEGVGARALGGEGHLDHASAAGLGQRVDEGRVGVDQRRGVLGAAAGHGEERPLEVDADQRAVVDQPRACGDAVE